MVAATAPRSNLTILRLPPSMFEPTAQPRHRSLTSLSILRDQMQLEADAREALPFVSSTARCVAASAGIADTLSSQSIENCTHDLGPLRQTVFSCLTCNPPPENPCDPYNAAGICYACSVQCHGEHQLVEIFAKRNFTCDCGTTRLPAESPCSLRLNPTTSTKGGVHSQEPSATNKYNQNFRNRFCSCEGLYDPFQQKGTMFQCLGLGTQHTGGCGEDWYHPGCVVGMGPKWFEKMEGNKVQKSAVSDTGVLPAISEDSEAPADAPTGGDGEDDADEPPNPPGFPSEDDFETFLCFKCVDAHPWIKRYAGASGFLPPVFREPKGQDLQKIQGGSSSVAQNAKKRKAGDFENLEESSDPKRVKNDANGDGEPANTTLPEAKIQDEDDAIKNEPVSQENKTEACKYETLPPAPEGTFSLFCTESFRERFCRCAKCFPDLAPHTQLLEEEEMYEPPVSEEGSENGGSTHGSGSLYERGESALRNVDRVRAIEGVMAYNQLKDKLKPFFQQFADSGQAISAEDIKAYFAKLRGDEEAIKEAGESAKSDERKEQPGY